MIKLQGAIVYRDELKKKIKGFATKLKEELHELARIWHGTSKSGGKGFLQFHFDTLSKVQARYPGAYKKRTAKYMRRKAAEQKHQRMLVWSGHMERELKSHVRVVGPARHVRAIMSGSNRALNFSGGRGGKYPNMREEVTAINAEEAAILAQILDLNLETHMNATENEKNAQRAARGGTMTRSVTARHRGR